MFVVWRTTKLIYSKIKFNGKNSKNDFFYSY